MAQKRTFSIRLDDDVKQEFTEVCHNIGLSPSTAFNMFARLVVRQKALPVDMFATDPFYSKENQDHIKKVMGEYKPDTLIEKSMDELRSFEE